MNVKLLKSLNCCLVTRHTSWKINGGFFISLSLEDSVQQCSKDTFTLGNMFVTCLPVLDEFINKAFAGDF